MGQMKMIQLEVEMEMGMKMKLLDWQMSSAQVKLEGW